MTLQNEIDIELWETVKKNYEAENYTGAILDSILRLTDTIRNKTGIEGDGASLIGQAFGGDNPRIKLNKLQTDSEKDAQRGVQEILRGIYTAIRNPRSHDAATDKKQTADVIIVFLNYLLSLIDKSKLNFDEKDFLKRVFDHYYVKSSEYSNLLVQEIPKRQRADIAITTILKRNDGDIISLGYFLASLLKNLEDSELSRVYKVISDELRTTVEQKDIRYLVNICPGKYWGKIEKSVRLRTENILYEDFSNIIYDASSGNCGSHGALSTWITADHLSNFHELIKWTEKTVDMLKGGDENLIAYINRFFWDKICYANKANITWPLKNYFRDALKNGDREIISKLEEEITCDEEHPWWKVFEEELKKYPDIKAIKVDELPF